MVDVVRVLCEGGADLEVICTGDESGWRALHWAVQNENEEIVRLLCDNGADVNACTLLEGWTPLMISCMSGNSTIVQLLMRNGARRDKKCKQGKTAVDIALEHNYVELPPLIKKMKHEVKHGIHETLNSQRRKIKILELELQQSLRRIKELETLQLKQQQRIGELEKTAEERESVS